MASSGPTTTGRGAGVHRLRACVRIDIARAFSTTKDAGPALVPDFLAVAFGVRQTHLRGVLTVGNAHDHANAVDRQVANAVQPIQRVGPMPVG